MSELHGMSLSSEYRTWNQMKQRCFNPNAANFKRYGARGITVCARWKDSFLNFLADMGRRPTGLTLDRIDNNGPYCPGNCRWATWNQQAQNREIKVDIAAFGETKRVAEWVNDPRCVASSATLFARINAGWNPESAITTPGTGKPRLFRFPRRSRLLCEAKS